MTLDSLILPLTLLYIASHKRELSAPSSAAPSWPTPASPPPLPAFESQPTPSPSADPSHSSTPLADLHKSPPKLPSASANEPIRVKQRASTPTPVKKSSVVKKATSTVRNAATKKANSAMASYLDASIAKMKSPTTEVPVASLQQILNLRGASLKRDGLFGPKLVASWRQAALTQHLPASITRASSRTANVAKHTYDVLSSPNIP